ncbi:GyrI-like domain-containing protein [Psychrobacillus sp. NEAU-3TGS]|uniref:GyrI-like domain-containing protein n=1 Tax=Psychrobacillus sp. NEAU-3TGS TaxID=2995412 RepID=UPI002497FEF3|nr:GyrI-like domain-containing protein [Psychrobacillus sp. NEAU-3TGS]MDI2586668.1 GyrI-like domain-containing protein [Psychrobacillus sp. NEAU-3TGS]
MSEHRFQQTIKELDEMKLVGLRVQCLGDQYINEIPKASMELQQRIDEIKQVINPSFQIGAFVVDNTTDEEDGYWVCVEVKEYENIPEGMVVLTVPSQKYGAIRHTGSNNMIRNSYETLHKWIEEKGLKRLKDKWHLEIYYSWQDPKNVDVLLLDTVI